MTMEREKQNLIAQIEQLGQYISSRIGNEEKLEEEVEKLVKRIEQWTEADVRLNIEANKEADFYNPKKSIIYPRLIERLGLRDGESVLEVGIGTGDFSLIHMRNFNYYAVDSSLFAVFLAREQARSLGISSDRILYAPSGDFHFDNEFNATFCVSVLHETENYKSVLSKMVEYLKSNGRLTTVERITNVLETPEHYQALLNGEKEIPAFLESLGFNIETENLFASYTGCDFNQEYKFCLISGER